MPKYPEYIYTVDAPFFLSFFFLCVLNEAMKEMHFLKETCAQREREKYRETGKFGMGGKIKWKKRLEKVGWGKKSVYFWDMCVYFSLKKRS